MAETERRETGLKMSKTRKMFIVLNLFLVTGLAFGFLLKYESESKTTDIRYTVPATKKPFLTTTTSAATFSPVRKLIKFFNTLMI